MSRSGFPAADSEIFAMPSEGSSSAQECSASEQASASQEEYIFWGKHFIASYNKCDLQRLTSSELIATMHEAIESSGASLISEAVHMFPNGGMTAVFLLAESHASIHTYPEHSSCFVDLFTCGDRCKPENLDAVMRKYLNPKYVDAKVLIRHESNEEAVSIYEEG